MNKTRLLGAVRICLGVFLIFPLSAAYASTIYTLVSGSNLIHSHDTTSGNITDSFGSANGALSYGDNVIYGFLPGSNQIRGYDASDGLIVSTFGSGNGDLAYGDGVIYTYLPGTSQIRGYDALTGDTITTFGSGSDALAYKSSVVPLPAALWLFGSGLLGLIGMSRRKS
jgi:hypothetical protein